ncbi:hypothetical protein C3941_09695 [Kaistia algarum]|nr:cell wall hydrolase [Kaistia algarum]MCX5512329.1 cell wall hydrolase [Kaistia algarum]PPE80417.1 hypothetical protein C3941_09695 [Kaistia algarum]
MVPSEQRVYYASRSGAPLGRDPRLALRRRKPRPSPARAVFFSLILAAALAPFGSVTVALQDVVELFGKERPVSERWLTRVVATPAGEAYLPDVGDPQSKSERLAESEGILIVPKLDVARRGGLVSAPPFEAPAVNRLAKMDITVPLKPAQIAYVRFSAGTLVAEKENIAFAEPNPRLAAALLPRDEVKTGDTTEIASAASAKKKIANPTVTLASIAPIDRPGKGRRGRRADTADVVSAYANPDDNTALEAPFSALLNKPSAMGIDGRPDHSWVTNPIPPNARSKTEQKCLATAIYFEARGEPEKGQLAVAQVVINRLKNPAYPSTVCGVVYQNKDMRNACQFSFACDGIKKRITDAAAWKEAETLARRVLFDDGWWNAKVGSSTHYHANYVKPRWARTMKKMQKIGHHIFYKTYGGGWS